MQLHQLRCLLESDCQKVNASGIIKSGLSEPDLSNPNWPITLKVELAHDYDNTRSLLPFKLERYDAERMVVHTEFRFDGSGSMLYPSRNFPTDSGEFAIWTWNIQRTKRDTAP